LPLHLRKLATQALHLRRSLAVRQRSFVALLGPRRIRVKRWVALRVRRLEGSKRLRRGHESHLRAPVPADAWILVEEHEPIVAEGTHDREKIVERAGVHLELHLARLAHKALALGASLAGKAASREETVLCTLNVDLQDVDSAAEVPQALLDRAHGADRARPGPRLAIAQVEEAVERREAHGVELEDALHLSGLHLFHRNRRERRVKRVDVAMRRDFLERALEVRVARAAE